MTREKELDVCRRKLREIAEQEAKLATFQRKAQQLEEETYYDIQSIVRNISENNEPLQVTRQKLGNLKNDFLEEITYERRKLNRQRDELEALYRKLQIEDE